MRTIVSGSTSATKSLLSSRKFVILRHDFFGSDSKVMKLQYFFQLTVDSLFYFGLNFLLQLVYGGFGFRILCVIVQPPKPTFFFDEI